MDSWNLGSGLHLTFSRGPSQAPSCHLEGRGHSMFPVFPVLLSQPPESRVFRPPLHHLMWSSPITDTEARPGNIRKLRRTTREGRLEE